jgi:hypothetical protein
MGKYKAVNYTRTVSLDKETDKWAGRLLRGGGNFSAWVRDHIRLQIAKEASK